LVAVATANLDQHATHAVAAYLAVSRVSREDRRRRRRTEFVATASNLPRWLGWLALGVVVVGTSKGAIDIVRGYDTPGLIRIVPAVVIVIALAYWQVSAELVTAWLHPRRSADLNRRSDSLNSMPAQPAVSR
jgi:hypothetical protein